MVSLFLLFQALVKTTHFSVRALVMRENLFLPARRNR